MLWMALAGQRRQERRQRRRRVASSKTNDAGKKQLLQKLKEAFQFMSEQGFGRS
jgi:hypothetical protein